MEKPFTEADWMNANGVSLDVKDSLRMDDWNPDRFTQSSGCAHCGWKENPFPVTDTSGKAHDVCDECYTALTTGASLPNPGIDEKKLKDWCSDVTGRIAKISDDNLLYGRLSEGMECYQVQGEYCITQQQLDRLLPDKTMQTRYLAAMEASEDWGQIARHANDPEWLNQAYARGVEGDASDGETFYTSCWWTDEDIRQRQSEEAVPQSDAHR